MNTRKVLSTALFTILYTLSCSADNGHEDFLKKATEIGQALNSQGHNQLSIILAAEKLFEKYKDDQQALQILSQYTSTYYSIVSDHSNALIAADANASLPKEDSFDIEGFAESNAVEAIINLAKKTQIVMVNEAHHISQHRVLSIKLLEGLYSSGYRYLALEGLSHAVYPYTGPLLDEHGYYTKEPVFSLFIKTAEELGFEIISYDGAGSTIEARERLSAETLNSRIFAKNSQAKVFIHVGYAHINEESWLAANLKTMLNIDPLTISQTKIREKSKATYEKRLYRSLSSKSNNKQPFVLINENNQIWSSAPLSWDIDVIWPRTSYVKDKPNWMILGRTQQKIPITLCKEAYPCLVEVYSGSFAKDFDVEELTAADKTIKRSSESVSTVLLTHGVNTLFARDLDGRLLNRIEIVTNEQGH